MSEMFEYDGVQYTKEQCDQIASEFFDPNLLNQYPFVHAGMTVRDCLLYTSLNKEASILGEVFFAITINGETRAYYIELPPQPTRLAYKLAVAKEIYDALSLIHI